jgi:hypothetical protein
LNLKGEETVSFLSSWITKSKNRSKHLGYWRTKRGFFFNKAREISMERRL